MKKIILTLTFFMSLQITNAQNTLTPELLWKLGRISVLGISKDEKLVIYKVATPSVEENKSSAKYFSIPVSGGNATEIFDTKLLLADKNVSPDGKYILSSEEVKINKLKNRAKAKPAKELILMEEHIAPAGSG